MFNRHATTSKLLSEDGIYAINVVDKMRSGRFLRSVAHTLGRTFPYVYVLRADENWDDDERYTFVVAAALAPLDAERIAAANRAFGRDAPALRFMPPETFALWQEEGRKTLLTDDFVPVDGMLAPLYLESR